MDEERGPGREPGWLYRRGEQEGGAHPPPQGEAGGGAGGQPAWDRVERTAGGTTSSPAFSRFLPSKAW